MINGYSGTQTCNSQCNGFSTCQTTQYCGDGIINGNEQCDGNNLNGQTCQTKGFTSGTLTCGNCQFNTAQCTTQTSPVCGNRIKEGAEQCDDGNLVNGDGCSSSCLTETSKSTLTKTTLTKGEVSLSPDESEKSVLERILEFLFGG